MRTYAKQFLVGTALLLTFVAPPNKSAIATENESPNTLQQKVDAAADQANALIKQVAGKDCYWTQYLSASTCMIPNVQLCKAIQRARTDFPKEKYLKALGEIKVFVGLRVQDMHKDITTITDPAELTVSIDRGIKGVIDGTTDKVNDLQKNIDHLQKLYKLLNKSEDCPSS